MKKRLSGGSSNDAASCWSDADLRIIMSQVDVDGDNRINFDEFVLLMSGNNNMTSSSNKNMNDKKPRRDPDEELRCAFNAFDEDGNGLISRPEITRGLKMMGLNVTKKDIDDIMMGAEEGIDFETFKKIVR